MIKLTITRLEERVVFDAAPLPAPDVTEAPAPVESPTDPTAEDADTNLKEPAGAGDPDAGDAIDGDDDAESPSLDEYQSPVENNDADLSRPGDSPQFADYLHYLGRLLNDGHDTEDDAAESADADEDALPFADEPSLAASREAGDFEEVDFWTGERVFDSGRYQVMEDFSRYLRFFIDFYRYENGSYTYVGPRNYFFAGRVGVDPIAGTNEMRVYYIMDNMEKAYLNDCKILDNGKGTLQLVAFRSNAGDAVFVASTANDPGAQFYLPLWDVLYQLRSYSAPGDASTTSGRYVLEVDSIKDGNEILTQSKAVNYLNLPSNPYPPGHNQTTPPVTTPGSDNPQDSLGQPSGDSAPDGEGGTGDEQGNSGAGGGHLTENDYDLAHRSAQADDDMRPEELPDILSDDADEVAMLLGEMDDSDLPVARDIALNIADIGVSYSLLGKGVTRLLGVLSQVRGLDGDTPLAAWIENTARRGERLVNESGRQVAQLLRAVRDLRALEADARDSMAVMQISGINAVMDGINQNLKVLVAGVEMLTRNILEMRGNGASEDVAAMLPDIERHMSDVAKELEALDGMRDTMFYLIRDARAVDGKPDG